MDAAQEQASLFPKIFRFITEYHLSEQSIFYFKLTAVSFFSGLLLLGIGIQLIVLQQNREEARQASSQREQVIKELSYWKSLVGKYKDYRDVYYRIATLSYQLGNKDESKLYVRKTLELDPNFEAGKVLGAKVGAL
jgi:tetratricopeptide (TPR) repeat protein